MKTEKILAEMQAEAGPTARKKSLEKALTNYLTIIPQYMCRGVDLLRLGQDGVPIPKRKIRCDLIGRYGNPQKYWFDWLHQHYPLFEEISKGYKHRNQKYGELTMVKPLNFTQEQLLQIESSLSNDEFMEIHYPEIYEQEKVADLFYWTPIDLESLKAFIASNRATARTNQNKTEVLDRNLKDAERILRVAEIMRKEVGSALLPQRINESAFGRMYLKGINLQTVRKEVRHAALGKCKEYDLENSVFAWKYDIARQIDPDAHFPATLEYLDRKDAIRKTITQAVFGNTRDYGTIKQAITAIGFGASKTNSCWLTAEGTWCQSSLREIIYSPEKLALFVNHSWVAEFLQEQQTMTKIIYDTFKDEPGLQNIKEILSPNGQPNKNKTISYLYQHAERRMMETLMDIAKEHRVLLLCHDAFYTKTPAPLLEMRAALRDYGEFGKIKELGHNAWTFNDTVSHIEHIREEERRAAEHYRSQGLPALTDEQIDRKIDWKLNRHRRVMNEDYATENGREFDNGLRRTSEYAIELDPFYN
jgi:hypothetical protein